MRYIISTLFILLVVAVSHAQPRFTLSPDNSFAVCPGDPIWYQVTLVGQGSCNYSWSVIGGVFSGGITTASGPLNAITWNANATSGLLTIEAHGCSNSNDNSTRNFGFAIKSLYGVNLAGINGPTAVETGATSVVYNVSPPTYPLGTQEIGPKFVTTFVWTIPPGWTISGPGGKNSITLIPDACTSGTITVKAKSNCGNFFSNIASKAVTRAVSQPGAITGASTVPCGSTATVTYSIAAVPGATSYTWTKPTGWSGTSNTSSITLTPDGAHDGTVTVQAIGCGSLESPVTSKPVQLVLTTGTPTLSGPNLFCTTGTYSLSGGGITPGATVSWSVVPSTAVTQPTGTGTTANLTKYTISDATITFTISGCNLPSQQFNMNFHIGPYGSSNYPVSGPSNASCNSNVMYSMPSLPGATAFNWTWPPEWSLVSGLGTNQITLNTGNNSSYLNMVGGNVNNSCDPGGGGSYAFKETYVDLYTCGGGFMMASPNPSDGELAVALSSDEAGTNALKLATPAEFSLTSNLQEEKYRVSTSNSSLVIPTRDLKEGWYVLKAVVNGKVIEKQILVKH